MKHESPTGLSSGLKPPQHHLSHSKQQPLHQLKVLQQLQGNGWNVTFNDVIARPAPPRLMGVQGYGRRQGNLQLFNLALETAVRSA